ncbi:MAG: hypothetical protein HC773_27325 [Scytonema sp. CRU_2_7]|nr:hypothetical protein [Scytonema sp. CRU_2_7]
MNFLFDAETNEVIINLDSCIRDKPLRARSEPIIGIATSVPWHFRRTSCQSLSSAVEM